MKYIKICAVLLAFLFISVSQATKPSIPSLKMEMSIQHNGNWEVGKENTVTFTFKPLEEVKHNTRLPDEAQIVFDSSFIFVSGNPTWSGFLQKDREYSITVVLRPTKPGGFASGGVVRSCLTKIRSEAEIAHLEKEREKAYENSPILKKKGMGKAKVSKKVFQYWNSTGTSVDVKGAAEEPDTNFDTVNGVMIRRSIISDTSRMFKTVPKIVPKKEEPSEKDSSKAEGLESGTNYFVSGRYRYLNNYGYYWLIRKCDLYMFYWDPYTLNWIFDYGDVTDDTGGFKMVARFSHILLAVYTRNMASEVIFSDGHFDPGDDFYVRGWAIEISGISGDIQVPDVYTTIDSLGLSGAFEIVDDILIASNHVNSVTGYIAIPSPCLIYWDPRDESITTAYHFGPSAPVGYISIKGEETQNRDEWDPSVIIHEYGHFIMDDFAEIPPLLGGITQHIYWAPYSDNSSIARQGAWAEAWATFFQAAAWGMARYLDLDNNDDPLLDIDLERPVPDAPYVDIYDFQIDEQLVPSHTQPVFFAYHVEGAITEVLWDLFDLVNDGNYYQYGYLYGHNNDYNQSDWWRGISSIWDVFWNYDPDPSDFDHNHPWDFHEFIAGWEDLGYPVAGHFTDICNSHGIQICVAIPGDLNADNGVTLPDVIYLTNYVFDKDRPATGCYGVDPGNCWTPDPVCRGEINGVPPIGLTDIIHLSNFVFDKDRPATNCYGFDPGNCWPPVPTETCCLPLPGLLALYARR